jgi:two-component system phosphate regulon sensor histidine kinase PhoR
MKNSARTIFVALSLLALGQMLWWAHLIMSQQSALAELLNTSEAMAKAHNYHIMIFAEGLFFLAVLSLGIWVAYRSISKEFQLQRSQSDFLRAITHELKTPLTNVRLCLDSLERGGLSEESRAKYIQRAQTAVDKLVEEVETVLTISNKDPLTREKQKFDLHELIRDVAHESSHDVNVKLDLEGALFVFAPYPESRLILRNLIDNAIKYSQSDAEKSHISIRTNVENGKVIARISDNGIGLTADEASQAFEPFYRGEDGRRLDPTGTGLGLSLVKRLADTFEIQISLKSEGRGKGTTASVAWPQEKSL